jgi:hypothetical protein
VTGREDVPPREVRPLDDFYQDLHRELPEHRGSDGRPSREDFLLHELPHILWIFAMHWDVLAPLIPERLDYRTFLGAGSLVHAIAVEAQLAPDGAVELVRLRIDTSWPDDPDDL